MHGAYHPGSQYPTYKICQAIPLACNPVSVTVRTRRMMANLQLAKPVRHLVNEEEVSGLWLF